MTSARTALLTSAILVSLASLSLSVLTLRLHPRRRRRPRTSLTAKAAAKPVYSPAETAIIAEIKTLRSTPDSERGARTSAIAAEIAALPGGNNKLRLANSLSNLSTEGDFGHASLQAVADTLTLALQQTPIAAEPGRRKSPSQPLPATGEAGPLRNTSPRP